MHGKDPQGPDRPGGSGGRAAPVPPGSLTPAEFLRSDLPGWSLVSGLDVTLQMLFTFLEKTLKATIRLKGEEKDKPHIQSLHEMFTFFFFFCIILADSI